jgi:hypothetical protein
LGDGEFKAKHGRFTWQGSIIRYHRYEVGGQAFITCLDDRLRAEEEQDYLVRIATHPETHTEAGYRERLRRFGTLTLTYHLDGEAQSRRILHGVQAAERDRDDV